jgi:uncharacterized protein YegP (UPF0339 family)
MEKQKQEVIMADKIKHPKFVLKKSKNDKYYFVLAAKNGQVIAQSEMYVTHENAMNGIKSVQCCAPEAEIDDLTDT